MEFIMELIFDIVIEGSMEISSEKKVPMPFRILAALLFLAFYLGVAGVLIYIGYDAMESQNPGAAVLFYAVGFGVLIGVFCMIRKTFKEKSKEKKGR